MTTVGPSTHNVRLDILDGQAHLIFEDHSHVVNILSGDVLAEMDRIFDLLRDNLEINALILESAKPGSFSAGIDVHDILDIRTPEDAMEKLNRGHEVFGKLGTLPFPTIAMIHGPCMGGGTEMALACDYRIATDTPQTKIGLPEVRLGVFPGLGGTQRLPRLIGLSAALKLILSGDPVDAKKALKIGLVDACIPEADKNNAAAQFASSVLDGKGQWIREQRHKKRPFWSRLIEASAEGRYLVFQLAQKKVQKRGGYHYPAPQAAIRLIRKSLDKTLAEGLRLEAEAFSRIALSPVSKNLIHVFFGVREIRKQAKISDAPEPREINSAAVIGTGIMGNAIAWLFSAADIPVLLKGRSMGSAALGLGKIQNIYSRRLDRGMLSKKEEKRKLAFVSASDTQKDLAWRDIAIEAVVEDLGIKKQILSEMEQALPEDSIIASCSSSFTVGELAEDLAFPERFIGLHFLFPADRSPLVEIVPGEKTEREVTASALGLARSMGKTPLVVRDCPGFLINRILCLYLLEAVALWQEGHAFSLIDEVMTSFGMMTGPFALLDKVGVDTGLTVANNLEAAYGWNLPVPEILTETILSNSWLGKKTRAGFYLSKGKKLFPNPGLKALFGKSRRKKIEQSGGEIRNRLLGAMICEAARCLEDSVVPGALHVDMAMILGAGFPAFRGGPLRYADAVGLPKIIRLFQDCSRRLGPRFSPPKKLLSIVERGGFYPADHYK